MLKSTLSLLVALIVVGCANPINRNTGIRYAEQADAEAASGNWFNARMGYARAITNGKLGGFDDTNMAYLWYQYGRASGVICDWSEAEKGFDKAYEIDSDIGEPTYVTLYELGQMNLDRKKYEEAAEIFGRAHLEMTREKVQEDLPLNYAIFLENYAEALSHTKNLERANELRGRSVLILENNPGKAENINRTPYGSQCYKQP